jgi:hypothetical protein
VKKGDVVVAFYKKAFEDQMLTTQTELAAAQRAFAIAQLAVDIQERAGASAVKLARRSCARRRCRSRPTRRWRARRS